MLSASWRPGRVAGGGRLRDSWPAWCWELGQPPPPHPAPGGSVCPWPMQKAQVALPLGWPGGGTHLCVGLYRPGQPLPSGLDVTPLGLNPGIAPGLALACPRLWTPLWKHQTSLPAPVRAKGQEGHSGGVPSSSGRSQRAGQCQAVPTSLGPGSRTKSLPEPRGPPSPFCSPLISPDTDLLCLNSLSSRFTQE